jgi:hypothetical protein
VIPELHQIRAFAAVAVWLALLAQGCATAPSFAIHSCTDGFIRNTEPELELLVPTSFEGKASTVTSGRNCKPENLGSLVQHGVTEYQFAGNSWDLGGGDYVTLAVEALPDRPLPAAWVEEFYESSARVGRRTSDVQVSRPTMPPIGEVYRLTTLNDLSLQTVVIWPDGNVVRSVLVATQVSPTAVRADHDELVDRAVQAAAAG